MKYRLLLFSLFVFAFVNAQSVIHVSGKGVVKMTPDQALIKVRVENEGLVAKEVQKMNNESINNVLKALRFANLDMNDVSTEFINLSKNYNYEAKKHIYVANQSIVIILKDLKKYESVMNSLLDSGVNRIDNVIFSSSEEEKYKIQARKKAVEVALQKAKDLTSVLNQKVGKATVITETNNDYHPRPMHEMSMLKSARSDASTESVAVGDMEVECQVQITFELL